MEDDASLDDLTLNPSFGLRPDPRTVAFASQQVNPETTNSLVAPVSTTVIPGGRVPPPVAPAPGQPVNLLPQNPANIRLAQTAAPVVPPNSIAVPVAPPARAPTAPGPVGGPIPGTGQGPFGSNMAPAPTQGQNVNPLQTLYESTKAEADTLMKRGSDPDRKFWSGHTASQEREEAQRLYEKANQYQQQIQTQVTNQQFAQNLGLRTPMPATADNAAMVEQALKETKEGNYAAYRGLHGAGQGARADLYQEDMMGALGKDVASGLTSYQKLDAAKNELDYAKIRPDIIKEATNNPNAKVFGLTDGNIPKTKAEYDARRDLIQAPLKDAGKMVSQFQRKIANIGVPTPITDEKVATPVVSQYGYSSGQAFSNTQAFTLDDGRQAAQVKGNSKDISLFGPGPVEPGGPQRWNAMTDAKLKDIRTAFASEEEKGLIQKYKMANDFWETVNSPDMFKYPAGLALVKDKIGALGRDVAEGSKAAGSIGLSKMMEQTYGGLEKFLNDSTNNWAAYKAWVQGGKKGPEVKLQLNDRLTPQSIAGFKMVADFEKKQSLDQAYRLDGPVRQLGLHGGDLNSVGLPKELQDAVRGLHETAVQEGRLAYDSHDAVIIGKQRYMIQPNQRGNDIVRAGSYQATLPPRGTDEAAIPPAATPTVGGPVVPGGPPSTPGGGGGASVVTPPGGGGGPGAGGGGPASTATPAFIRGNPIASTVYSTANQTATNLSGGNATVGTNVAAMVSSSAKSESSYKPHELHDKNAETGQYAGYGLFGHQGDRLSAMQKHAGVSVEGKPGQAISPEAQTTFYTREVMEAAKSDPFIAKVIADPNASAEDLTRVQMRMEKPEGYVKGQEEKGKGWSNRLAATQQMMIGQGRRLGAQTAEAGYTAGQSQFVRQGLPGMLPAAGGVLGGIGGTAVGGPVVGAGGAIAGGALGGVAKNYLTGAPVGYGQAAGEGAIEAAPMAVPGMGPVAMGTRALIGGATQAGEALYEGSTVPEAANRFLGGAAGAAVLEGVGQALGMTKHLIWTGYSKATQEALADAGKVLSKEPPKIADATGKMVVNPKYETAEKFIKEKGQDPEAMRYAVEQVEQKATKGEAFPGRPGGVEKLKAKGDLQAIQDEIQTAGAAAGAVPRSPPPAPPGTPLTPIPKGPLASIDTGPHSTGKIDAVFTPEATRAESLLQRSAANMGERWGNAVDARAELLAHERKAIRDGDTVRAQAMRDIADTVRGQQDAMAKALLPKAQYEALMNHLTQADIRYRKAIMAGGDDIVKTIAAGGKTGNQARAAFDALAGKDPTATRMMNALTTVANRKENSLLAVSATALGALSFAPVVGPVAAGTLGVITVAKARQAISDFMVKKGAAKLVTMRDLIARELSPQAKAILAKGGATIGAAAGAQGASYATEQLEASP